MILFCLCAIAALKLRQIVLNLHFWMCFPRTFTLNDCNVQQIQYSFNSSRDNSLECNNSKNFKVFKLFSCNTRYRVTILICYHWPPSLMSSKDFNLHTIKATHFIDIILVLFYPPHAPMFHIINAAEFVMQTK